MARATGLKEQVLDRVLEDEEDDVTEPVTEDDDHLPAVGQSIVTPKQVGKRFQKMIEDAQKVDDVELQKWDKCFELYRKCGNEGIDENVEYRYHHESDADENIVRTNIRTIMRNTYMQNPHLEFTDVDEDDDGLPETLQYIVTYLMNKQTYPGLNVKPKVRRWILHGQLTNFGVLRLDYQSFEGSRQDIIDKLKVLEAKLAKAKTRNDVDRIYSELEILHEDLPLTQGKGMGLTNVLPHCLVVDPNCTQLDLSDADWVAEWFDMDRSYYRTKYFVKKGDEYYFRSNEKRKSKVTDAVTEEDSVQSKVISTVTQHETTDRQDLRKKDTVRCYYIYDKILRRVYLYSSEDWSTPLWVEEDDMGLSRFFRHFILAFGEPIEGIKQPGEVSFWVGQVNEINRINRKAKHIRDSVFNTLVFNTKNVDGEEVKRLVDHMKNPQQVAAFGIAANEDTKISDMLEVLAPPALQYKELFSTENLRSSIDRSTSSSEVDRGAQFKTNTTNDAVQYHAISQQKSNDVLIDMIEDSFEALGWSMSELLVSKYKKEDIEELVGKKKAENFQPMSVEEFNYRYRMVIAAGSIEKPTTQFKKQEAREVAQALGQIGQAAPGTTMKLMIKMFEQSFSNFNIKKEDWELMLEEIKNTATKGVSTPNEQRTA